MATQAHDTPQTEADSGTLFFLDEPAFASCRWTEGGLVFLQAEELDLVASGSTVEEAASKLGDMIVGLLSFLVEEVEDPTESESELARLITDRIGPPLLRLHREYRRQALLQRVRSAFRSTIEWKVGPSSTPHGYAHVLSC